jgi:hypothetical protein
MLKIVDVIKDRGNRSWTDRGSYHIRSFFCTGSAHHPLPYFGISLKICALTRGVYVPVSPSPRSILNGSTNLP